MKMNLIVFFPFFINSRHKFISQHFYSKECEEQHPFNSDLSISSISERLTEDSAENEEITCEKFQESTKDTFAQLIEEIKVSFKIISSHIQINQ